MMNTLLMKALLGLKFHRYLFSALLFFISAAAQAQTLYQVEIIVFERKGMARTLSASLAETNPALNYPDSLYRLASDNAEANSLPAFDVLPPQQRHLTPQATAITASKQLRVLFHQAWQQPVGDISPSVAIQGGSRFGNHYELEGFLNIHQSKILEISTNLWLTQFLPATGASTTDAIQLPDLPTMEAPLTSSPSTFTPSLLIPLQRAYRIKPGEIQYLDHPVLGILIKAQLASDAT